MNLAKEKIDRPGRMPIELLSKLKRVWWRIDRFLYPAIAFVFNLFGVDYYLTVLSDSDERKLDKASEFLDKVLFSKLSKYMDGATAIQFSLGELGAHLMENPAVLGGIKNAIQKNKAKIQIVGGPRIDPNTKQIFDLAKKGLVDIYRTPKYNSTHFIIITDRNGKKIIINEGVHEETIWSENKRNTIFRSITRAIYLYENKKQHINALSIEFERRKNTGVRISRNPGINPPQSISNSKLLIRSFLWEGFVIKHIIQPISICLDLPLL